MRVQLFTFRFSPTLGAFDDTPLKEFIRDKDVLAFREHFFVVSDVPHLACIVTYQDAVVPPEAIAESRAAAGTTSEPSHAPSPRRSWRNNGRHDEPRPDPTAGLDEAGRALFNTVREWRAKTARSEGVPPYVILTNRELVRVVVAKPQSPTALGHIEGIGPGKVERYGASILACLNGGATPAPMAAPDEPASKNGTSIAAAGAP